MQRLSSLTTQLVFVVLAAAIVAFAGAFAVTFIRLNHGLERQAAELGRLSEEKLRQKLDGEARLAGARIEMLFANSAQRLEAIAQRADVAKAIATRNSITISDLLGRAARSADLDGILVVDAKLRVLGADRESMNAASPSRGVFIDILETSKALAAHPIAEELRRLVSENDRKRRSVLKRVVALNDRFADALGTEKTAALAFILVEPIFDDFGDVFAAVIAHRSLRAKEERLEEFSRLEGAGLVVLGGEDQIISFAGLDGTPTSVREIPGSSNLRSTDGRYWSRCAALFDAWRVCSLAPESELTALRDEMVRIGETEGRALASWLVIGAVLSLLSFTLIALLVSRRISRPLAQITQAVRAVARGDWKSDVTGAERKDEVGDIARAVITLQRSLEERDRLRSDIAQAEQTKKRREMLEDAIRRFDRMMRSVLLSVSDSVETMDETARELARTSIVAEGEAAEAAFVSEHTVSNVATLREATERLSASMADTTERIRQTAEMLSTSTAIAETTSAKAKNLAEGMYAAESVLSLVQEIAARANALALQLAAAAGRKSRAGTAIQTIYSDIKDLADKVSTANEEVARRIRECRGATEDTVGAVGSITQKLDLVLQQTKMIALAMDRQDATTREIAASMASAANGTMNVSSSVDRLKVTIEEARSASTKVIAKATDMADEAHRLDSTVKTFLREVTA